MAGLASPSSSSYTFVVLSLLLYFWSLFNAEDSTCTCSFKCGFECHVVEPSCAYAHYCDVLGQTRAGWPALCFRVISCVIGFAAPRPFSVGAYQIFLSLLPFQTGVCGARGGNILVLSGSHACLAVRNAGYNDQGT